MRTIQDIMTRDVQTITPQETVQRAAQLMDELNVGAIPVLEGDKLVGTITERDITLRPVAAGQAPASTKVGDVATRHPAEVDRTLDEISTPSEPDRSTTRHSRLFGRMPIPRPAAWPDARPRKPAARCTACRCGRCSGRR